MNFQAVELKKDLSLFLKGRILLVGIGNTLKSDDGFGPLLIARLKDKVSAECIDASTAPENYIGPILKYQPDTIIFFDAVSFGGLAGELRLIQKDQIGEYGFSTHNMSPRLMIEHIDSQIKTNIIMLGVEPKLVSFGGGVSEEIRDRIDYLENVFMELLGNEKAES